MSTYNQDNEQYLPGSDEHELCSLLNELGAQDRAGAPSGLDERVLDAIAGAVAPSPLMIGHTTGAPSWISASLRIAAAIVIVGGVAITAMFVQRPGTPTLTDSPQMIAAALEDDFESLLALDEMTEDLDESVAQWTLWAQAVDSDLNSPWMALDLIDSSMNEDGAL